MRLKTQYIQRLIRYLVAVVLLLASACSGCFSCNSTPEKWRHESQNAPYKLLLSGYWKSQNPKEFNDFADLALTRGPLHAIIIAQKLDPKSGFREPTPKEIESQSLQQMAQTVQNLVVEDEIEHLIGDSLATTVYSRASIDGADLFYTNTYLIKDHWIFQIICWSPLEHREALTQAAKELLTGWNANHPQQGS